MIRSPSAPMQISICCHCVTGVFGVPKQRWELDKVRQGATLYLSSNDGYMLNFVELTDLTVQNLSRRANDAVAYLQDELGDIPLHCQAHSSWILATIVLPYWLQKRMAIPFLAKSSYGKGVVYFCALPLELAMSQQPGVS